MATGELRERVRERLVSAEPALDRALAGAPPTRRRGRARCSPTGRATRSRCAATGSPRALADFDAATIATTHGFCQEVLGGLGVAGDVEPRRDVRRGRQRPRRRGRRRPLRPPLPRRDEPPRSPAPRRCGSRRAAVDNPARADRAADARRRRVAGDARAGSPRRCATELERAQAARWRHDLRRPAHAAATRRSPAPAATARRARLRERYRVVLVDEFQDTDPVQWDIMRRAFGDGGATLVLIGDPKQAIYAFRGADVYAYLDAARAAGDAARRSTSTGAATRALIDAYDALFGGAQLGHEGIVYRRVRGRRPTRAAAAGAPRTRRCACGSCDRDDPAIEPTRQRLRAASDSAREHIAARPRRRRRALLLGAEIAPPTADGARRSRPATSPCSCAPTATAALVRDALDAVGVPAVINGAGSVFAHRAGARVAAAAGGARAADLDRARARRRADVVPRLDAPSGSPPPATTSGRRSTGACTTGRAVLRRAGVAVAGRDDHAASSGLPGARARAPSTASGG